MTNPYAPPRSPPNARPEKSLRLFTPLAIGVHAVFVPWFSLIFAIMNSVRLRRRNEMVLYAGLFVATMMGNVVTFGLRNSTVSGTLRLGMLLVGLATAWQQSGIVGPRLVIDAQPARWYLWWLGLLPVFVAFLVVWQFLAPTSRP